ncbi:MAG: family 20 glycosylhydrolase [Promethearchaeia archaeon]
MVRIKLTWEKIKEKEGELRLFSTPRDIRKSMLPLPKEFSTNRKWHPFSISLNVQIKGAFISQEEMARRGDLPPIPEPEFTREEFCANIPQWLNTHIISADPISFELKYSQKKEEKIKKNEQFQDLLSDNARSEAYYLSAKSGEIIIESWTKRGAYYAFLSLSQLLRVKNSQIYYPTCEIIDYPDFEIRGLVDDISRGQRPTMENFKKFIQFMSSLKLNVLVLYIEDMFKFEKYPRIGKNRAPLTRKMISELEEYALDHFIEIQPAFESFGHQDNLLTIRKFRKYGEFPGAQCFDVSNPDTKEFVDDLLSEICPAFKSEAFHLICDESHDFGLGKSREYIEEKGEAEVLAEWYLFLVRTAKKYGKTYPTIAHDVIYKYPKTLELVKGEIPLIVYWEYSDKEKYPTISKLKEKGFTIAGLPGTFDWSRHYPYYDYAAKNMICMAQDGLQRGMIGHITTSWGDFFNENFRENLYYGLGIEGQAAWNAKDAEVSHIKTAFNWLFFGTEDNRIMECMEILNKQNEVLPSFPNGMMNRFWMDPHCREIDEEEINYAFRFINESLHVLEKIKKVKNKEIIQKNQDNLDFIRFAAQLALHYGVKLISSKIAYQTDRSLLDKFTEVLNANQLMDIKRYYGETKDTFTFYNILTSLFEWLKKNIKDLQSKYEKLWLLQAVPEGLQYPLHRFDVLQWHYQQSLSSLESQKAPSMHQLKAHWIWRSGRRFHSSWGNQKWFYFYKTFVLPSKEIEQATCQGIAANHMRIFVNGKNVGEVISRFSLSHLPVVKSVQLFDVSDFMKENNENIICIEGKNWTRGIGGLNFILHIEYTDGTSEDFISDPTWLYSKKKPENWPLQKIWEKENENWKSVRSFGSPPGAWQGPITRPVWEKGWKSKISFSFGLRNFIETSITSTIGKTSYKLLFWLIPFVAKLLGTDMFGFRNE